MRFWGTPLAMVPAPGLWLTISSQDRLPHPSATLRELPGGTDGGHRPSAADPGAGADFMDRFGAFHGHGCTHEWMVDKGNSIDKLMIWGYPYFRSPPKWVDLKNQCGSSKHEGDLGDSKKKMDGVYRTKWTRTTGHGDGTWE